MPFWKLVLAIALGVAIGRGSFQNDAVGEWAVAQYLALSEFAGAHGDTILKLCLFVAVPVVFFWGRALYARRNGDKW